MSTAPPTTRKITPMLRQYLDAKAQCPGALLLFRMGDFFELFFDDAKVAAHELDITLTAREKGQDPVPMAGVPHHAINTYIARLLERGHSVALCDQIQDPRTAKGLVARAITRIITPGTLVDLEALDPGVTQYLACVHAQACAQSDLVVALLDLLAGELLLTHVAPHALGDELRRLHVREVLCIDISVEIVRQALWHDARIPVRPVSHNSPSLTDVATLSGEAARALLTQRFGSPIVVHAPSGGDAVACIALAAVIGFAEATQRQTLTHLQPPRYFTHNDVLVVDEATRHNLELCRTARDCSRQGSLLWHLDRCATAMGARLLRQWLLFALRDAQRIARRAEVVELLRDCRRQRAAVRAALGSVRDVERLLGRVAMQRATPRDLGALRDSLQALSQLGEGVAALGPTLPPLLERVPEVLSDKRLLTLGGLLDQALLPEPPTARVEGGIFARGYRPELDTLLTLCDDSDSFLQDLEKRERVRTGIASLKIRFNRVFGYYIEITRSNLTQVPADYTRKQTMVNAERFTCEELKGFEHKILTAHAQRCGLETQLFAELCTTVLAQMAALRRLTRTLAGLDVLQALAEVADAQRYVRPEICAAPVLELQGARHPTLECLLPGGESFVPNDLQLGEDGSLLLLTGPNMAGKSTVMRQAALCVLMAHMGALVPCSKARIGLCDRLFTRVGASDNLGRGQSTFMVEMMETATILRDATPQSFVLLDEIGRGTSTFDGLAIATAVAEDLHDRLRCRAMFATHYHELCALAASRPRLVLAQMSVVQKNQRIVFLRQMRPGAARQSFGIEVARLAGVPPSILERAHAVLQGLQGAAPMDHPVPTVSSSTPPEAYAQLMALDVTRTTPLQALALLTQIKQSLAPCGEPNA